MVEGGGGTGPAPKTVSQTIKRGKVQNSNQLHNLKHMWYDQHIKICE